MPYSGTERSLMNFGYKKRFQLVKTIRLSTYIVIFVQKIQFLFWVWRSKSHFFRFNDVKSTDIFIFDITIVDKCLVRGANFGKKKSNFGDPTYH